MKPILNVIKYEGDNSTFVWKHPAEDFNMFSQLIVHESQEAIFLNNGQIAGVYGPGRHTLETLNIPIVKSFIKGAVGGESPFHCEVYFINKTVQTNLAYKWGTENKIRFIEPIYNIPVEIGACGELNLQVLNSRVLLLKLVGNMKGIAWNDNGPEFARSLQNSFRAIISNSVKAHLPATIKEENIDLLEIDEHLEEISEMVRKKILPDFAEYGLTVPQFFISHILLPENDPNFRQLRYLHTATIQTKTIETNLAIDTAQAEAEALKEAARRKITIEKNLTDAEIAKHQAEMKIIEAQAEADKKILEAQAEADKKILEAQADSQYTRLKGLAEAEVMAAKGYSEKDVLTADVQKAYAEGIGNMTITGTGGGVAGDMIGLGVGMAAAGAIAPQLQEMLNVKNINSTSDATIKCTNCGTMIQQGSKFCPECGSKSANTVTCPNCNKEIPAGSKFCLECGYKFATVCPKCNTEIPAGSKFCLECGEKI